ncbi:MAG: NDP-hexose 4-ketoreductase, partial [Gemmataceae bacterium]
DLKRIIDIELAKVCKRLSEKGLMLNLTDEAKEFLIEKGSNREYGARPLRRAIEQNLEDPLSEDLLRGSFSGKDVINVVVREEAGEKRLTFEAVTSKPSELVGAG